MISIPAIDITYYYYCYYFWKHGKDKDLVPAEPSSVSEEWALPGDLVLTQVLMRVFPETEPEELAGPLRAAFNPSQRTETEAWSFIQSQVFHRSPTGSL